MFGDGGLGLWDLPDGLRRAAFIGGVEYGRWPNGFWFASFPRALPLAMLREAFGQKGDLKPALQAWRGFK